MMSQLQGSGHSSALFLTAAAQNLLAMKLASEAGVVVPSTWVTWFKVREGGCFLFFFVCVLVVCVWGGRGEEKWGAGGRVEERGERGPEWRRVGRGGQSGGEGAPFRSEKWGK